MPILSVFTTNIGFNDPPRKLRVSDICGSQLHGAAAGQRFRVARPAPGS
jgi:hypothetical protein